MAQRKDPVAAWRRFRSGNGPLHDLTLTVARAVHAERYKSVTFDHDSVRDQWLAVGSWQTAEAVVQALPLNVKVEAIR